MRRWVAEVVVACVMVTAPAGANADEADDRFARGVELFADGRHEQALAEFEASRAARETSRVVFNIGVCLRALSRWAEAAETFDDFLEMRGTGVTSRSRAQVQRFMDELAPHLARLTVVTNLDDARVWVNERLVSSFPVWADVGAPVAVEARRPGHVSSREIVRVSEPGPLEIRITLRRDVAVPEVPTDVVRSPPLRRQARTRSRGSSALPWVLVAAGVAVAGGVAAAFALSGGEPLQGYRVDLP